MFVLKVNNRNINKDIRTGLNADCFTMQTLRCDYSDIIKS